MKTINLKYFPHTVLIILICIFSMNTSARTPAVDPVIGLSIDEYKQVPPEKSQGYTFSETPTPLRSTASEEGQEYSFQNITEVSQHQLEGSSSSNLPTLFLFLVLLVLPFGMWWFIHRKIEDEIIPENTIDFGKHLKDREEAKKNYDKAS